jgi:hypothetical protein
MQMQNQLEKFLYGGLKQEPQACGASSSEGWKRPAGRHGHDVTLLEEIIRRECDRCVLW